MAVWSSLALRNICKVNVARNVVSAFRNEPKIKGLYYVPVRNSHERTLRIKSSSFHFKKLKDLIILYLLVGIIPLGTIIAYVDLFIGPATLALIPEGYEPKPYEYYRHPITRFFAKFIPSPQEMHERNLHNVFIIQELYMITKLRNKIENAIKHRQDYQAWYYKDPSAKYLRKMNEDVKEMEKSEKIVHGWVK